MAVANPPAPPPPTTTFPNDWMDRLINAVLVAVIAIGAFWVYSKASSFGDLQKSLSPSLVSSNQTTADAARQSLQIVLNQASTLFGTLTTFLGTALGAYFGISVSASTAKVATNTATTLAAQNASTQTENQQLKAQQTNLSQQLDAKSQVLTTLIDRVQTIDPNQQSHPEDVASLQQYALSLK